MKNTLIFPFLMLPFFLLAQEQTVDKKAENTGVKASDLLTQGGSGTAFLESLTSGNVTGSSVTAFDNRYEGVKGTPFWFDDWSMGSVLYDNTLFSKELEYRYDVIKNDLHIKFRSGEVRIPDNFHILQFSLKDKAGKTHFFDHALVPDERPDQFYEVLYSGKQTQLLKLVKKELRKADYKGAYSSDQRSDEFITKAKYFLRSTTTGTFAPVKIKRKALIAAFPVYQAQLEDLLDGKEYKSFDETSFAQALKHIETQWMK